MDIELLRTFLEVNRTGHFGKAADNLYLTQSAVSARIKQLEDSLGVVLFERQRNNLRLTSSGMRFMRHAENIVASWQRARQEAGLEEEFSTSLAVAGLFDLWEISLLDWLIQVRKHEPDIAIHASAYTSQVLNQQVLNGQLDLAFLFEPQSAPELSTRFLKRTNLKMVSTLAGLSSKEAISQSYIMIDWGTAYAVNHAKQFPDAPSSSIFLSHGSLALSYILRHGGTAYLPEEWSAPLIDSQKLFLVNDAPVIEREINVIWRTDNEKSNVLRKVLEYFE